jgi:hypothetical protein
MPTAGKATMRAIAGTIRILPPGSFEFRYRVFRAGPTQFPAASDPENCVAARPGGRRRPPPEGLRCRGAASWEGRALLPWTPEGVTARRIAPTRIRGMMGLMVLDSRTQERVMRCPRTPGFQTRDGTPPAYHQARG